MVEHLAHDAIHFIHSPSGLAWRNRLCAVRKELLLWCISVHPCMQALRHTYVWVCVWVCVCVCVCVRPYTCVFVRRASKPGEQVSSVNECDELDCMRVQ